MTDKYKIIWDFCDWLRNQGLAYETIYYGTDEDLEELIKQYDKEEKMLKQLLEN